jgi:hypothetical protein
MAAKLSTKGGFQTAVSLAGVRAGRYNEGFLSPL